MFQAKQLILLAMFGPWAHYLPPLWRSTFRLVFLNAPSDTIRLCLWPRNIQQLQSAQRRDNEYDTRWWEVDMHTANCQSIMNECAVRHVGNSSHK